MTYFNFHIKKPNDGEHVYFVSPEAKEVLGVFAYPCGFNALEGNLKGYVAKYWRPLNEVELTSLVEDDPKVQTKRKYTKRIK